MPIITACPSCGGKLRVSDDLLGLRVRCPACGHTFVSAAEPEPPPPSPQPPLVPDLPLKLTLDEPSEPRSSPPGDTPGLVGAVELKLSLDDAVPSPAPPPPPPPADPPLTSPPPRLADEHDDLRECPSCGRHLHRDSTRCYHCGERVGGRRSSRGVPNLRRRSVRRDAEPDRGALVLSLGIISLATLFVWCFPIGLILGLVSWVMGGADLRKMQRGEMDTNGEGMTRAGWICGIIGTLLNGLVTLGCMGLIGFAWYDENHRPVNTRPYAPPPPIKRPAPPNKPMRPNNLPPQVRPDPR